MKMNLKKESKERIKLQTTREDLFEAGKVLGEDHVDNTEQSILSDERICG